ncbi:MAG TPA: metal ABC transporter substrate-binding protein [Holophaga sp.]|nr:metal ABC transporter substrate-binding protein [Holophaga sp.]
MRQRLSSRLIAVTALVAALTACSFGYSAAKGGKKTIVTTYSVLGAVVKDLVGDAFEVKSAIPNGLDVHEWEPSAKDIEALTKADLVVENGLDLEGGMGKALDQARAAKVPFFTASDHVTVRTVGAGEGIPSGDPDQAVGAKDPHLWTDPLAIKAVVDALAIKIKKDFGVDLSARTADLDKRLAALDTEVRNKVNALPAERRKLVTGHESLGYFAQRYGFKLVGAVIPSLTTQAESSAASLAALKKLINQNNVKVVFTETGTPARTVEALAKEAKVTAIPLSTHKLPADGSYFTFERELADTIIKGLK